LLLDVREFEPTSDACVLEALADAEQFAGQAASSS
jgi:hypothetical protein